MWLDGDYLGNTDGYFVPHEMEITDQVTARPDHVLAVAAMCARFGDPDRRTSLTGALQDPELIGSDDVIVGGIWRPARIRSSGPIAIRHARAVCADVSTSAGAASARLALRAVLDVPDAVTVELRTRVCGAEHVRSHPAAAGDNRVEWNVDVSSPKLWWPHALGDQPLFDLSLEATAGGRVHDCRRFRIGFRKLELRRWTLHVNGERLHLKGVNLLPARPLLGTASAADTTIGDIRLARTAGLDLVRPVAHIARPELYNAADETGMLVWQDLPVRGVMSRSVSVQARRQAREAVDLLGHHPSVAFWCAHDEPFARTRSRPVLTSTVRSALPAAIRRRRPSWNRDVLDRWLCRILERCDGSRPVVAHTAVPARTSRFGRGTVHLWVGPQRMRVPELQTALARMGRKAGFVSAFGTPTAADAPDVIKTTIEALRRLKYRPNGGFLLHALADASDMPDGNRPGFGVFDAQRKPKPGRAALLDACRPLTAVCGGLPPVIRPGSRIELSVHVVNDYRHAVDDIVVRARILGPAGLLAQQGWSGAVGADNCALVGRVHATAPAAEASPAVSDPITGRRRSVWQKRKAWPGAGRRAEPQGFVTVELDLSVGGEPVASSRSRALIG